MSEGIQDCTLNGSCAANIIGQWGAERVTWGINDRQVGAVLVLDLDHDLLGPELLLPLQASVLILNVLLHPKCSQEHVFTA